MKRVDLKRSIENMHSKFMFVSLLIKLATSTDLTQYQVPRYPRYSGYLSYYTLTYPTVRVPVFVPACTWVAVPEGFLLGGDGNAHAGDAHTGRPQH